MDLQRKQNLPANKLATLMAKFDEVKTSGNMMPTATLALGTMEGRNQRSRTRTELSKPQGRIVSRKPSHLNIVTQG